MNNTSELFSFTYERDYYIFWFLNELNLIYQRLTGFVASFDFIPIVLVPWDRFLLCFTPIISFLAFQDHISILIVGCVGSHQLASEQGSKNKSYPFAIFVFLVFVKFFSMFASIFFFVSFAY
jgi:hypothetical protein